MSQVAGAAGTALISGPRAAPQASEGGGRGCLQYGQLLPLASQFDLGACVQKAEGLKND